MITREQIETAFGDDNKPYQAQDTDYTLRAVTLLRERIPYDVCKSIIGGVGHDTIYLCDLEQAMPHLSEEDLSVLVDCNVFLEGESDCFALFV